MKKKYIKDTVVIIIAVIFAFAGGLWMMTAEAEYLTTLLDNIGILIGLVTAVISIGTWFNVRRINDRLWLTPTDRPDVEDKEAVLIISIGKEGIEGQVIEYLRNQGGDYLKLIEGVPLSCIKYFKNKAMDDELFVIDYHNKNAEKSGSIVKITAKNKIPTDELLVAREKLYKALHIVSNFLRESGVSRIRIFYSGLSVLCFFIADELSNNFAVSTYHFSEGKYHYAGDLNYDWHENGVASEKSKISEDNIEE